MTVTVDRPPPFPPRVPPGQSENWQSQPLSSHCNLHSHWLLLEAVFPLSSFCHDNLNLHIQRALVGLQVLRRDALEASVVGRGEPTRSERESWESLCEGRGEDGTRKTETVCLLLSPFRCLHQSTASRGFILK